MDPSDKIIKALSNAQTKGSLVPPRNKVHERYDDFVQKISTNKSPEKDAWDQFSQAISPGKTPAFPWAASTKIDTSIVATAPRWAPTRDDYARLYLLGLSLTDGISIKKNGTKVDLYKLTKKVWGENIYKPTKFDLPKPDSAADSEMKAQNADLELFLIHACRDFVTPAQLRWICYTIDVLAAVAPQIIFNIKREAAVLRPYEIANSPDFEPVLDKPTHSSWPSGHAFFAGLISTVVFYAASRNLLPEEKGQLWTSLSLGAVRIAFNRERAGLHFRKDSQTGLELGDKMAAFIIESRISDFSSLLRMCAE